MSQLDRRDFLKSAGAGITAAGVMLSPREQALAQADAEKNRLLRIAACSYPIRYIFKSRAGGGRGAWAGAGRGAGAAGQPGPGPDRAGAPGTAPAQPGAAAQPG